MGDRSIQGRLGEGFGGLHIENIDANTTATEQFTEERTVAGKNVFVSPEGAQQLDAGADKSWTLHVNGSTWDRLKAQISEWRDGK